MDGVIDVVCSKKLTYEQKIMQLASLAENSIEPIALSESESEFISKKIICTMFEGNAPYRPRYICPDYEKLFKKGCAFLELSAPCDIWEAISNLLIFYKHVPSITSMPVYMGNLDSLLDPLIKSKEEGYRAIKIFLKQIDKTFTDSFCHANIGPKNTLAGELILNAAYELNLPTPNLTLKYNNETPDDFAIKCLLTAMKTAKPSFANDAVYKKEFGGNYAIASCYNGLPLGGGSYTLVRSILSNLAKESTSISDFLDRLLPLLVKNQISIIEKRIRFIVEKCGFFETNFLVMEDFINLDKFTAMFGIVGLAECVNYLYELEGKTLRFGHDEEADNLGLKIIDRLNKLINEYDLPYCKISKGKALLHAQVGLADDKGVSPGCRIPIGEEPELCEHVIKSAKFHKHFQSGIGDIFVFDDGYKNNPEALLDILKGSFSQNMRYFSLYGTDTDVVRVSGYLVKKSEMAKLDKNQTVLRDTTALGLGQRDNLKSLNRRIITGNNL